MNGLINKIKESIQAKLQLFILSSATIVFLATILYVSVNNRQMELDESIRLTKEVAQKRASDIQSELNKDFALTHTMAAAMQDFVLQSDSVRNHIVPTMLKRVFERNRHLQSLWIHWELSAVVPDYPYTYGRVRKNFFRKGNTINYKIDTVDRDGDNESALYYTIKTQKESVITEPYWYSYSGDKQDEVLETSICVPVLQSTKFLGLMGIDIKLDRFEKLVGKIRPFNNSYAFFVSHKGTFVYHPTASNIGGNLVTDNKEDNEQYRFDIRMESGKPFSFRRQENGQDLFVTFAPVFVGDTDTPWYLSIVVPYEEMTAMANKNMIQSFYIGFIGLLFLAIILYIIARNITRPLTRISNMLKELAAGKINTQTHLNVKTNDEIGSISSDVNGLKDSLGRTAMFASEIGKGNLDAEFQKLSDNDVIGKALLDMRESLRDAKEEDLKRQRTDEIQKWITNGIARINEIMRQHNELDQLAYAVVKYIVDALKANQGAFYVLNESDAGIDIEDITFETVTALAWGRKKPLHRKIKMGETLIGRAAYEQATLYMTEIPENYVNITSGLGKANPRSLLIVPLILNEEVMGILEVISFHELEKYQVEFVEKAGESIASTIASVKISQRTARLLEQTKSQASELTEKEEELRQQMEEMEATQEEASKRQSEMSGMITAINSIAYVAEYSMDGYITHVNEAYAQLLEMPQQQIIGKKQGFFQTGLDDERSEKFEQLWVKMRKGIPHKQEQKIEVNNNIHWLSEVYTPIIDMEGSPIRVINIAMDITHLKSKEE